MQLRKRWAILTIVIACIIAAITIGRAQSVNGLPLDSVGRLLVNVSTGAVQGIAGGVAMNVTAGGTTTASVPSGAANTVVKNAPARLARIVITTIGTTTNATCFDNATTNSGTVLAVIPGTTADSTAVIGKVYTLDMPAANGITCANTASGPVFTVSFQ